MGNLHAIYTPRPGILHNDGNGDILVNPGRFNPKDATQWQWIVDDNAPDEDTISQEDGQSFLQGLLYKHDLLADAYSYFVGYSRLGGQSKVRRSNPAKHPRIPAFRCSGVSIKGYKFDGREVALGNRVVRTLDNPVYKYYKLDVRWKQWEWDFLEDAEVDNEWQRCIKVDPYDLGEVITVDGGQYVYNAPSTPSLNNTPYVINGPSIRLYAQRSGLRVTSWGLPAQFILDNYCIPNNFLKAKGHVNSTTFLNKPAGTMLLQTYDIRKVAQPIQTVQDGALAFNVVVTMDFAYTDPPRAEASETLRGWQLVPGLAWGNAGWYGVTSKFGGGQPLYPTFDMNRLLQYRDNS